MRKRDLTHFGLKWNPFSSDVPIEALMKTPKSDLLCWRVEQQIQDGGFLLVIGEPGTGKSILLRQLAHHLSLFPDVAVGVTSRPQSHVGDFYRELGSQFGVQLSVANRYGGFKTLRERWQNHIETTTRRPVLLYDEAQLAQPEVLTELRLLSSTQFDSTSILTVILCGDGRLLQRLQSDELRPLESRMRFRLFTEPVAKDQLVVFIRHVLEAAGNPNLMTKGVIEMLAEHSGGNYRSLTVPANELLTAAVKKDQPQIDEQLYFDTFAFHSKNPPPKNPKPTKSH